MKRFASIIIALTALFALSLAAFAADDTGEERTPLQGLDRIESVIYGAPATGGLLLRLSKVEQDLFGMELPGSLTERQQALQAFVEDGNVNQPSLIFKISVAEWITLRRTNTTMSFADRVTELERTLEGETQEGALSARLERILTKLVPSGVAATPIQIPAGTVFKARFVSTLTVRNVERGDIVNLELIEDCIINGTLAAAKGNRVVAEVTKVRLPRSFGRPSEINLKFQFVETIGGRLLPVTIGPESEEAMKLDSASAGAIGVSLIGAIVAGPVGAVGGFLIRGSDKQIKEGTLAYVETSDFADVEGYAIPNILENNMGSTDDTATYDTGGMEQAPPPGDTTSIF